MFGTMDFGDVGNPRIAIPAICVAWLFPGKRRIARIWCAAGKNFSRNFQDFLQICYEHIIKSDGIVIKDVCLGGVGMTSLENNNQNLQKKFLLNSIFSAATSLILFFVK